VELRLKYTNTKRPEFVLNNTEDILEKFAKRVIQQSRTRLTKGKMNVDKKLYNSLKYDLKVYPTAFILQLIALNTI
jgi:hypothetical protein